MCVSVCACVRACVRVCVCLLFWKTSLRTTQCNSLFFLFVFSDIPRIPETSHPPLESSKHHLRHCAATHRVSLTITHNKPNTFPHISLKFDLLKKICALLSTLVITIRNVLFMTQTIDILISDQSDNLILIKSDYATRTLFNEWYELVCTGMLYAISNRKRNMTIWFVFSMSHCKSSCILHIWLLS